jgi:L,D-peptidoglycan transpeptidase YkuD (ErfK/YbiS/YcfS/YnhG family)
MGPEDGWCDAAGDPNYNRGVRHPYPARAERMWRDDPLYDIVIVTSHNRCPRIQGGGSAIFIHVARAGFAPTAGCVALERRALLRLLTLLRPCATIEVGGCRRRNNGNGPTPERGEPVAMRFRTGRAG